MTKHKSKIEFHVPKVCSFSMNFFNPEHALKFSDYVGGAVSAVGHDLAGGFYRVDWSNKTVVERFSEVVDLTCDVVPLVNRDDTAEREAQTRNLADIKRRIQAADTTSAALDDYVTRREFDDLLSRVSEMDDNWTPETELTGRIKALEAKLEDARS